jgi:predicted metal-dependent phosphoesterase TrpH
VRVDIHVHSSASFDCRVEPERVWARCRQLGLDPVFLTDHNTIAGATKLRAREGLGIVIGEEVMTRDGELIGLFLSEAIAPGLSAIEAAERIKSQGGLVYLEHPYDPFRRHLSEPAIEALSGMIDVVEVWNGKSDEQINQTAVQLSEILGAAQGAGSDAHTLQDIGSIYVELEPFDGAQDFLAKLRRGKISRRGLRDKIRRR